MSDDRRYDEEEIAEILERATTQGILRSWTNGNLQVHVEPDGDGYRVRMRTHKGNVTPRTAMSASFIFMSMIFVLRILADAPDFRGSLMAAMFGAVGVVNSPLPGPPSQVGPWSELPRWRGWPSGFRCF